MNSGVSGAAACGSYRTPLSAWKEGAGAWSSAAGRQLAEGIGDRTDTCGSMRKFAAVQEMDGAILVRLHHNQWCWPYLYFILSLHRHMATTSDPMLRRGSSAEHVCWRRSAVRWARGHTGPFRRTPATTPSPSEPSPSLYLRPLGRYSSGARGATAMQASALEASVNELIDTIFGCYPSSKAAGVVPKGVPTIWHKSTARHLAHALKLL